MSAIQTLSRVPIGAFYYYVDLLDEAGTGICIGYGIEQGRLQDQEFYDSGNYFDNPDTAYMSLLALRTYFYWLTTDEQTFSNNLLSCMKYAKMLTHEHKDRGPSS
jgi:hypothetical protein